MATSKLPTNYGPLIASARVQSVEETPAYDLNGDPIKRDGQPVMRKKYDMSVQKFDGKFIFAVEHKVATGTRVRIPADNKEQALARYKTIASYQQTSKEPVVLENLGPYVEKEHESSSVAPQSDADKVRDLQEQLELYKAQQAELSKLKSEIAELKQAPKKPASRSKTDK